MSKALANKIKLNNIYDAKTFGATGDGTTNDTAALQAALDAAMAVNGTLYIPAGTYRFSTLSITDNVHITGDEPSGTVLRQISGANTNAIVIDGAVSQNPIIENLTIDGNRSGNSSGNGIHLPASALSYGFSVVLYNVYVQNVADDCLYVGTNRNMGHVENTEFKRGGRCVYITGSSDWRFMHGRFAFPKSTYALELESGADNVFVACAFYGCIAGEGSGTTPCVLIDQDSSSPTKLIGCTINYNDREGLWIRGPSGIARHIGHQIIGCWFAENSLLTNGGYANIKCTDVSGCIFVGNDFRWNGSGNKPSYLVEFTGSTLAVEWTGNQYLTNAYVTGVSNTLSKLGTLTQTLTAETGAYLGGASGSQSFYAGPGVSGGNWVQVTGRAAGTGPDISTQGVDANISLRLYTKGTGAIEMVPGTDARAARFMQVTNAVNYTDFYGATTGNAVQFAANGSDTNIGIRLVPKGTGAIVAEGETTLGGAGGSQSLQVQAGVSGGNYIQIQGRAAGTPADISAQGSDTNINLRLYSKGTGAIELSPGSLTRAARFIPVASAVNYTDIYGSATGQPVQFIANGTDTNIDLRLTPKGTGRVRFGTHTATADTAVSGYIEIVDSGGTVRKLAVIT